MLEELELLSIFLRALFVWFAHFPQLSEWPSVAVSFIGIQEIDLLSFVIMVWQYSGGLDQSIERIAPTAYPGLQEANSTISWSLPINPKRDI